MSWYYEIAIGSPNKRGTLIPSDEIPFLIKEHGFDSPIYRSVYLYPESSVKIIEEAGGVKSYTEERYIDYVPIDIDKGSDTDIEVIRRTLDISNKLEYNLGLDEMEYQIYYSGTGFHIDIPRKAFGFSPSKDLPYIVKATMEKIFGKVIDPSIYSRTGLYRLNYTRNQKSGLFKVPVTRSMLEHLNPELIKQHATLTKDGFHEKIDDLCDYTDFMGTDKGRGTLSKFVVSSIPSIKTYNKVLEPTTIATCIQTLYNQGPTRGNRNLASLRIASHFKRSGIPSTATKAAMLEWNNNSLDPAIVTEHVENVYNRNYKYGCEDSLLKKVCSTRCVYYKNKDYMAELLSAEDMQKLAQERVSIDYTGRTINLSKLFGVDADCMIYPGELVTIIGPTGSGKTAVAQHIALGVNMVTGLPSITDQLDTVYLSLELSPQLMHRRNLQIVSGKKKGYVVANLESVYNDYKNYIDHIKLRTTSGDIKAIEELIRQLSPKLLVVDYLDLIETKGGSEHEQIKTISHGLSSLAVRYDMIIIAVAQVRRDDARENNLTLYSGKGSGAIENASRKVLAVVGQANSPLKHIKLLKNTDGETFEVDATHDGQTLCMRVTEKGEEQWTRF